MGIGSMKDRAVNNFTAKNPTAAFDPASAILIVDLIMQFIQMFQDCKKDADEAVEHAKDPTFLMKRIVHLRTRRELGRKAYKEHGRDMAEAIIEAGGDVTLEEMVAAYDEIENN